MEATVMRSEWRLPASFEWRRMRMEVEIVRSEMLGFHE
ncbi:uncharacterized protein G2W53_037288 [Senna tora]|uniref:Uncharacterized protein n=1 Tax=Senna tora TaxID=362788 RepID=A0A834W5J5_9FABA|nr:uncharacterized protein G2W53_037288 [Senna tora]